MYELYVAAEFEAAHRLPEGFGPASGLHGHTYRMEVILRGDTLDGDGVLYDIGALREAADRLASSLHYHNLNEVPGLAGTSTTAEEVAHYCWERLAPPLRGQRLDSLAVRIWENPRVYAAREDGLD